ncbi:hypothetical protein BHE90_013173 [Fusarium euwallaceae]|uniref:Uncharacterized protein n=1 Tax=Fusarium euwallaceae TaxID=1147111 RepID=A0A430L9J5_9HYPO|nr:hypothetical protein BHE90_013173 [Fusarium euwallaceae]
MLSCSAVDPCSLRPPLLPKSRESGLTGLQNGAILIYSSYPLNSTPRPTPRYNLFYSIRVFREKCILYNFEFACNTIDSAPTQLIAASLEDTACCLGSVVIGVTTEMHQESFHARTDGFLRLSSRKNFKMSSGGPATKIMKT